MHSKRNQGEGVPNDCGCWWCGKAADAKPLLDSRRVQAENGELRLRPISSAEIEEARRRLAESPRHVAGVHEQQPGGPVGEEEVAKGGAA